MVRSTTLRASGLSFPALTAGDGPLVLCLHGFPDDLGSFSGWLPALAEAGYRAVAPALRGYAPSCQPPDGDYCVLRGAEDVLALMDALGADQASLVGHDWGAITAYATAALSPNRVRSLVTLAVPHFARLAPAIARRPRQLVRSWYVGFFHLRRVAEQALARDDFALLERLWRTWSPGWEPPTERLASVRATFRRPGVALGALGWYRTLFALWRPGARDSLRLLRMPVRVPTLALTGARDGCMDSALYDAMDPAEFPSGLRVERLADAGHFLHLERPDRTLALTLEHLAAHARA